MLASLAGACTDPQLVASDCQADSGLCSSGLSLGGGSFGVRREPPLAGQDAGGPIRSGRIARLDLLLVVDRSASMREEREAFADQLAPLLEALTRGDVDGAGQPEFLPVADLRVALVSSDLGAGTASGNCTRAGDAAGRLLARELASPDASCAATPGGFLSLDGPQGVEQVAAALACRLRAPEDGCRIEQPMRAALTALERELAVSDGRMEDGRAPSFLRPDSLIVILVLADEDDCSAAEPDALLTGDSSTTACIARSAQLSDVVVLSAAIRELRTDAQDLAMLAVFAGVPADLVDVSARLDYALETGAGRDAFYTALLDDSRMALVPSTGGAEAEGDRVGLRPACASGVLAGYPAQRLVQAARAFGAQGVVQSVCDPNAWQLVAHTIGRRLGSPER